MSKVMAIVLSLAVFAIATVSVALHAPDTLAMAVPRGDVSLEEQRHARGCSNTVRGHVVYGNQSNRGAKLFL